MTKYLIKCFHHLAKAKLTLEGKSHIVMCAAFFHQVKRPYSCHSIRK